jgi:hypothetical protein
MLTSWLKQKPLNVVIPVAFLVNILDSFSQRNFNCAVG